MKTNLSLQEMRRMLALWEQTGWEVPEFEGLTKVETAAIFKGVERNVQSTRRTSNQGDPHE